MGISSVRNTKFKKFEAGLIAVIMILISMSTIVVVMSPIGTGDPNPTPYIWTTDEFGNPKYDFSPGEIVYIHGAEFTIGNTVDISITRPDGEVDMAPGGRFPEYLPVVDENSNFDYESDLNGIFGTYTINASDGIYFAETTFNDTTYYVESYSDNTYTTVEDFFNPSQTVYGKGGTIGTAYYLKLEYKNPNGVVKHQCVSTVKTNTLYCDCTLPSEPVTGEWDLFLYASTKNNPYSWFLMSKDHFYVGIEYVENPELPYSCGIDMVLILDSSMSIDPTELSQMKTAFKHFVDIFLPLTPTEMAVVEFDTTAKVLLDYTNDAGQIKSKIDSCVSGGFTNWDDALYKAHGLGENREDIPNLYVFSSDGNPNHWGDASGGYNKKIAIIEAIEEANTIKEDEVRIITLGIGDELNPDRLVAISSQDAFYDVDTFADLEDALFDIVSELCGGTIFVKKTIDGVNASGWEFNVNIEHGELIQVIPPSGLTDENGSLTFIIDVEDGYETATVDIIETIQPGYMIADATAINCLGQEVGTLGVDGIYDLDVGKVCYIYAEFDNTEVPPPETTKEYGNPKCVEGDKDYITSHTPIYLNATSFTGCFTIHYRVWFDEDPYWTDWIDGPPNTNVSFTMNDLEEPWNKECEHIIEFYADCEGNAEEIDDQPFWVDNTGPPAVDKTVGTPKYGPADDPDKFVTTDTTILLTANDPDPGCSDAPVSAIHYIIRWDYDNDGVVDEPPLIDEEVPGNTKSFEFGEACMHELEYWAVDCLGNEGAKTTQTHYVDMECPSEEEIEFIGPHYIKNDIDYITNETIKRITISDLGCDIGGAEDEAAGVEKIDWYVQNKNHVTIASGSVRDGYNDDITINGVVVTGDNDPTDGIVSIDITILNDCVHYIYHRGVDYLGNECNYAEQEVRVDTLPPIVTKEVGEPSCQVNGDWCVTNKTRIWITATDNPLNDPCDVGSVNLTIGIWYNGVWHYDPPIHVDDGTISIDFTFEEKGFGEDCTHYLSYWAEDDLGNRIAEDIETFNVSSQLPKIYMNVGEPNCTDCGGMGPYDYCVNMTTPIYITVESPESGCVCPGLTVEWSYNNITWYPLTEDVFYFDTPCEHTLYVRAYDCRNIMVYAEGHFYVDVTPPPNPSSIKEIGEPKVMLGDDEWLISPVTPICFDLTDFEDLGCCPCDEAFIEYRIWYYGAWGEWTDYTDCIYLTEGCVHYLEARAKDCLGNTGEIDNETFWVCAPGGETGPEIDITYPTFGSTHCKETIEVIIEASDGETPKDELTVVLWIPGGRRDAPTLWYYPEYSGSDGLFHADIDIYNYQSGANLTLMALAKDGDNNIEYAVPVAFTVCSTTIWDQWMQYGWNKLELPKDIGCNDTVERAFSCVDSSFGVFYKAEDWLSYYSERTDNWLTWIEGGETYWVHITDFDGVRYYIALPEVEIEYPEDLEFITDPADIPDEINGFAWDSQDGITDVQMLLYYKDEGSVNHYWDGFGWTTTMSYLPCDFESYPPNYKQNWLYDCDEVEWFDDTTYYVYVMAYDMFGCYASDNITFSIDFTKYTITGTVSYYGSQVGNIFVELVDYYTPILIDVDNIPGPGSYMLIAPNGTYLVGSFMDLTPGNTYFDEGDEPAGLAINKNYYAGDSPDQIVVNGANKNNIDIILYDPPEP